MAYLRTDSKGGEKYLRIVKSVRKEGKVNKQTLYSLGKVSDYTPEQLKRIGSKFFELGGGDPRELFSGTVEELGRYNYGYFQLFRKVLQHYGLDRIFSNIAKKHKLSFDLYNSILLMCLERLHEPSSKRSNFLHQEEYLGVEPVKLHHLYRSLDYLADHQELIQKSIYQKGRDLFNQSLDVVFYDVTTFYFDSETETPDALRQKGFSKDGKIGNTQILFGMLIDKDKNPIAYKIYKGDTFEGHTFQDALIQLKQQYCIKDIIVVADRGMLNKTNLELTTGHGFDFIIGERLKTLPENIKGYLTNIDNYKKTWVYNQGGQEIKILYTTTTYRGRKIICTYSQKRAIKDAKDREDKLETAAQLLKNQSLLKKKAQHYFLQESQTGKFELNQQKIAENKRFDGFLAIATSAMDLDIELALDHYRHLFQIEHSFRTYKSFLETRPMFHWTDKRIQGHICLCYLTYTLITYVQNKLKTLGKKLTENQIREAVNAMQVSLVNNHGIKFFLRSSNKPNVDLLTNQLGLRKLPNILPESEIYNYL